MEKVLTYTEAKEMYEDELMEINMALDIHIDAINRSMKK